jgi:response regulator RpfG family c-di-GMP phosphodiesterase
MNERVLCVDDDPNVLAGYQRGLRKQWRIETASSGQAALSLLETQGPYAVIVADMQMPGMNGVELLTRARTLAPNTVRIMLTGNADQQTAVEAVNEGHVFRFLNKPCSAEMLALVLDAAARQYQLVVAERELLEKTLSGSVKILTEILSLQDPRTFGRSQTLRELMREFVQNNTVEEAWTLELGAMLAHLGMVTLPPPLLAKTHEGRALTPPEAEMLSRVPEIGAELLVHIPRLAPVAEIIRYRSKHYDGSGTPTDSVAGDAIPIGSRILKVLSDMLDLEAQGYSRGRALQTLQTRVGCYDPRVLDAVFACFDVYLAQPTPEPSVTRSVTVRELRPGDLLRSSLETRDGMLILAAGNEVSAVLLEKVRNFARLTGVCEPILVEAR